MQGRLEGLALGLGFEDFSLGVEFGVQGFGFWARGLGV